jgi:hypothetical protein
VSTIHSEERLELLTTWLDGLEARDRFAQRHPDLALAVREGGWNRGVLRVLKQLMTARLLRSHAVADEEESLQKLRKLAANVVDVAKRDRDLEDLGPLLDACLEGVDARAAAYGKLLVTMRETEESDHETRAQLRQKVGRRIRSARKRVDEDEEAEQAAMRRLRRRPRPELPHKLVRRRVRCGRPACRCRGGPPHGPYWYAYLHWRGRTRTVYIGKRKLSGEIVQRQIRRALGIGKRALAPEPSGGGSISVAIADEAVNWDGDGDV